MTHHVYANQAEGNDSTGVTHKHSIIIGQAALFSFNENMTVIPLSYEYYPFKKAGIAADILIRNNWFDQLNYTKFSLQYRIYPEANMKGVFYGPMVLYHRETLYQYNDETVRLGATCGIRTVFRYGISVVIRAGYSYSLINQNNYSDIYAMTHQLRNIIFNGLDAEFGIGFTF